MNQMWPKPEHVPTLYPDMVFVTGDSPYRRAFLVVNIDSQTRELTLVELPVYGRGAMLINNKIQNADRLLDKDLDWGFKITGIWHSLFAFMDYFRKEHGLE